MCPNLWAQDFSIDTTLTVEIPELMVTATRNERLSSNVTVPTLMVNTKAIKLSGTMRLNEVLQEQTGLFLTSGTGSSAVGGGIFGNGIQIQGLSPDYTLLLLDGEPIIGRQGGVIDLSRFTVGNIRKIEVVKGPSSALYGSEAMGGVINILTEQRRKKFVSAGVRYGSFNTLDINGSGNMHAGKSSLYIFANHNLSDGYDLQTNTPEKTVDPYHNTTAQLKWTYRFSDKTRLIWNNRIFTSVQNSAFAINSTTININGFGKTKDININPVLEHRINQNLKTSLRLYASLYNYEQKLDEFDANTPYYFDDFQHNFLRVENQTDWDVHENHQLVAGGGYNHHTVETIRYRTKRNQKIGYYFVQDEWKPSRELTIIPGLRYDANSDYSDRLSPKISAQYKVSDRWRINLSYGSGFKAPDFRQLYLYYVNPAGQGYRVYGASEFSLPELQQQQKEGLISTILPEAYQITQLKPEISHGFNLGTVFNPKKFPISIDVNVFYNSVKDMINYLPVAILQNNALVFSYMNINNAYTAGFESNIKGSFGKKIEWNAGYQYLQTGDKEVIQKIKANEVFGRNSPLGSTKRMTKADYTGLLGRSPHMANIKIMYSDEQNGWGSSLRAVYRSKWGIVDLDGNRFANMKEEYAQGFVMLNISVMKTINKSMSAQFNVNNLLNYTDAANLPQMPGAHLVAALHWNLLN